MDEVYETLTNSCTASMHEETSMFPTRPPFLYFDLMLEMGGKVMIKKLINARSLMH